MRRPSINRSHPWLIKRTSSAAASLADTIHHSILCYSPFRCRGRFHNCQDYNSVQLPVRYQKWWKWDLGWASNVEGGIVVDLKNSDGLEVVHKVLDDGTEDILVRVDPGKKWLEVYSLL